MIMGLIQAQRTALDRVLCMAFPGRVLDAEYVARRRENGGAYVTVLLDGARHVCYVSSTGGMAVLTRDTTAR